MSILSFLTKMALPTSIFLFSGCQTTDLPKNPFLTLKNSTDDVAQNAAARTAERSLSSILSLTEIVVQATPKINVEEGFAKAVAAAVRSDPVVQMAKAEVFQQQARLGVTKAQLDFQFAGTVYAGVEDVTDETNGIAAVLNASKIIFDGGQIASSILADEFAAQSALESYKASLDQSALGVAKAWVELERYADLNALISSRLVVLDPLTKQLEEIARAGVGDATQVAAAQRTVSMIRITQTDVEERMAQAELNFIRLLGNLPKTTKFDFQAVAKAVPRKVAKRQVLKAPSLLANYSSYMSALHRLEAVRARDSMTVGFETKVQRPFGQSAYDSDESIGFVVRKTLYNGDKVASEVRAAQAGVERQEAALEDVYRRVREAVETNSQTISSINKAINMARENALALKDEIALLRKQLVIGQSSLDSVLSAEARLYDAESKEINFTADKRTSQLGVLSAIGLLSHLVGLRAEGELN